MCEMINAIVNLKLGKTGDYTDNRWLNRCENRYSINTRLSTRHTAIKS